ncbi:MAG: DUF4347 domain-containing protein, partial [Spirulina sp. SIO3F2]|nr:DUF4347 domain-containing protein [Spirulina sp. SIO3F2]
MTLKQPSQQLGLGVLLTLKIWSIITSAGLAQSITVAPDGTSTIIDHNGKTYHIEGGTQVGENLFHSFQTFGLSAGEIANFQSHPSINNIFGRVVGGNISMIDGLIQANSNLYLMNPAGMVFGPNASLNVGGDFFATTADRIGFENGWFNATGTNDYAQLAGTPNQFAFISENPSAILNQGSLQTAGDLSFISGTVQNQGEIISTQGNITLAAVPGTRLVNLAQPGMLLSLDLPETALNQDISLLDLPGLLTGPVGDVDITGTVQGEQIDLYAAGRVIPSDPSLMQGKTRVIRFSETGENPEQAVFIDRRADNPEALLYGAESGTVTQIIDRDENGIDVVTQQLREISNVVGELESVAIVAEGNAGNFWLGDQWIRSKNIADYQQQLQTWGDTLTKNADILLYSCFTALDATGEALINNLANLTGADVAASVDLTGSSLYGGDWELEAKTGTIEGRNPFTAETWTQWEGKLATLTVQNAGDNLTVDGSLTLREALQAANTDSLVDGQMGSGTDTIMFDTSGVFATAQTITTTLGEFTISDDVVIQGTGQSQLAIDGGGTNRVFNITNGDVTLRNLTVRNGRTTLSGGGIQLNSFTNSLMLEQVNIIGNSAGLRGGGIYAFSKVTAIGSFISGNVAGFSGGGISSGNDVTVISSTVLSNSAVNRGGGIYTNFSSSTTVTNSPVSGNSAGDLGGGIFALNDATITNSTVSGNSAINRGGGIFALNGTTTLNNSTVSGNLASLRGGGIYALNGATTLTSSTVSGNLASLRGGGIYALNGATTLTSSTVSGNSVGLRGGGIYALNGATTLTSSTVSGNSAGVLGGGIYTANTVTVTNSTLSGNSAGNNGGGIVTSNNVTLTNSTVSGNSAGNNGGGIYAVNNTTATQSTVSGNSAGNQGGGIFQQSGAVNLLNATIAFNRSSLGGGIAVNGTQSNSIVNSIVANNSGSTGADINANFSTSTVSHSLIQNIAGITGLTLTDGVNGNIIGQDPRLAPLANNGGSTLTHALFPESPAIDAGDNSVLSFSLDQRGQIRIFNGTVDMGAL